MAKVLCVLYEDPVEGYPTTYAREEIPTISSYPGGQSTPSPRSIDFDPGHLLGCVSGELGLRSFLETAGHTLVVTSDKDGADSEFERELPDADVVISQPFWPAYLTAERMAKAPKLKLAITAGIGSDHVDLQAAMEHGITVTEVTYSNSISVSEHVVMMILALVRNYLPSYGWVIRGRLEHRRLRRTVLRPGGDGRWNSGRRSHRPCSLQEAQGVRRRAPLHRPTSAPVRRGERAWA